ncbi:MAG: hypothetical protein IJ796_04030 [Lachnospiraceae bacterium]|nr:hypothetical protein [Lachnospiraceae bacterium]
MNSFFEGLRFIDSAVLAFYVFTLLFGFFVIIMLNGRWTKGISHILNYIFFAAMFALTGIMMSRVKLLDGGSGAVFTLRLQLPLWALWLFGLILNIYYVYIIIQEFIQRRNRIDEQSIKIAFDTLPDALVYFMPSGMIKLCNPAMYEIYRHITGMELQSKDELSEAVELCRNNPEYVRYFEDKKVFDFGDGHIWRYIENPIVMNGELWTECFFTDITQLYNRKRELELQSEKLRSEIRKLGELSGNAMELTREYEILSAKTRLHDRLGSGLTALRQSIAKKADERDKRKALEIFKSSLLDIMSGDDTPERSAYFDFLKDAESIGVEVSVSGNIPKEGEAFRVFMIALRECLTNAVRHGDATRLAVTVKDDGEFFETVITNNGSPCEDYKNFRGGLMNVYRNVLGAGGTMDVFGTPVYTIKFVLPRKG